MPSAAYQRDELIAMKGIARFNEPTKDNGMKLRLGIAIALLPLVAHAEDGDKQSIYQISPTAPANITSSSSVRSALLPSASNWRGVRIAATVDVHCRAGDVSVTATVNDTPFWGKSSEYIKVQPSDGNYVACIADSTSGKVWIDPAKQ
ncbi:hypothetical protein ACVIHC_002188 [Bradyrhizobium diazoefficiens]